MYGQQSMSVKKDLLKSLSADVAPMRPGFMPPETPALLENVDKRETRRTAAHGGAVHSMTFE
ncbi:hypothetical protein OEK97_28755, partial [Escherichia coli]|uniref:hypothetical protein n=1 Tax=Escherichia coli TaxID=562 RepID=UPI0021D8D98E